MAAATTSFLRRHRQSHSLLFCSRSKHSLPDRPIEVPKKIGNLLYQFHQSQVLKRSSSSPRFGLVRWYLGMINTRPVATKSVTAALIYTAADLSSQTIVVGSGSSREGEGEEYDVVRTLRMAGYGMLIVGPSLHYWFNFVSRVFPKRDLLSTLAKMALGQTVYGPIVTALFFSLNAALQGESGSEVVGRLKRDLFPTLVRGVMYWPICDFITFRFVPLHLQPLVSNSFSYLWTVYLTYMAGLETVKDH